MVVFFAAAAAILPACIICASDLKLSVIFLVHFYLFTDLKRDIFFFFSKFINLGGWVGLKLWAMEIDF